MIKYFKKAKLISCIFFICLTINIFGINNVAYAEEIFSQQPVISQDIIIKPMSVITYWERNGIISTYIGDYELVGKNLKGTTTETTSYSTTCESSQLASVEAAIKANGGIISGKVEAGVTNEGVIKWTITYTKTIEKTFYYDRYIKYKYYYEGGNLLNDHGCIIKVDSYHFFIKKESTGNVKDVVVG